MKDLDKLIIVVDEMAEYIAFLKNKLEDLGTTFDDEAKERIWKILNTTEELKWEK